MFSHSILFDNRFKKWYCSWVRVNIVYLLRSHLLWTIKIHQVIDTNISQIESEFVGNGVERYFIGKKIGKNNGCTAAINELIIVNEQSLHVPFILQHSCKGNAFGSFWISERRNRLLHLEKCGLQLCSDFCIWCQVFITWVGCYFGKKDLITYSQKMLYFKTMLLFMELWF